MYERFTDRARKVMQLANQEAQRFNHKFIGPEHILLGLLNEGSGVAAYVLKNLNTELSSVRLEVEKILVAGAADVVRRKLELTPRAKLVIEYANDERCRFKLGYVGTEHILLGLLRQQEGIAAQVLMNLGADLNEVREEVMKVLGMSPETWEAVGPISLRPSPPSVARRFGRWLRCCFVRPRPPELK